MELLDINRPDDYWVLYDLCLQNELAFEIINQYPNELTLVGDRNRSWIGSSSRTWMGSMHRSFCEGSSRSVSWLYPKSYSAAYLD